MRATRFFFFLKKDKKEKERAKVTSRTTNKTKTHSLQGERMNSLFVSVEQAKRDHAPLLVLHYHLVVTCKNVTGFHIDGQQQRALIAHLGLQLKNGPGLF